MLPYIFTLLDFFLVSSIKQNAPIGFVGLGNMGAHMARNLLKNGHDVRVYDISADSVKSVTDAGNM